MPDEDAVWWHAILLVYFKTPKRYCTDEVRMNADRYIARLALPSTPPVNWHT